jgi:hypothetical protein
MMAVLWRGGGGGGGGEEDKSLNKGPPVYLFNFLFYAAHYELLKEKKLQK